MRNWTNSKLALGALAILYAGNCQAKLGETKAEIEARYGTPIDSVTAYGDTLWRYSFGEFEVKVAFENGRSAIESLKPEDDQKRLEDDESVALIAAISGTTNWTRAQAEKPLVTEWRSGSSFAAVRMDNSSGTRFLAVMTAAYYQAVDARRAKEVADSAARFAAPVSTNAPINTDGLPRLGATEAELEKQYGKPVSRQVSKGLIGVGYQISGFSVQLDFQEGKSASLIEILSPLEKRTLGDEECLALIKAVSGTHQWLQQSSEKSLMLWFSPDGMVALRENGPEKTKFLQVCSLKDLLEICGTAMQTDPRDLLASYGLGNAGETSGSGGGTVTAEAPDRVDPSKRLLNFFRKRADAGDAEAMFQLGQFYLEGKGGKSNTNEAKIWFQKAADQGNAEAKRALEKLDQQKEK